MKTGDQKWHCTKGIVEQTATLTTRAVKRDALGLATKRAEKLLAEKAVQFLRKETEVVARDTAEELKRR